MAGTTDINIVLGQGSAIKEVHNVKKQNLEINQHFAAQATENRERQERSKVQELAKETRVEIKGDGSKKDGDMKRKHRKGRKKEAPGKSSESGEGNLIDIRV